MALTSTKRLISPASVLRMPLKTAVCSGKAIAGLFYNSWSIRCIVLASTDNSTGRIVTAGLRPSHLTSKLTETGFWLTNHNKSGNACLQFSGSLDRLLSGLSQYEHSHRIYHHLTKTYGHSAQCVRTVCTSIVR